MLSSEPGQSSPKTLSNREFTPAIRRNFCAVSKIDYFMKIPFVDLHAQYLTIQPEIDAAIQDVITQSAFIRGPHVDKFERSWADTLGMKHCVSCANGTDALYI